MPTKSKRFLTLTLTFCLAGLLLQGCSKDSGGAGQPGDPENAAQPTAQSDLPGDVPAAQRPGETGALTGAITAIMGEDAFILTALEGGDVSVRLEEDTEIEFEILDSDDNAIESGSCTLLEMEGQLIEALAIAQGAYEGDTFVAARLHLRFWEVA